MAETCVALTAAAKNGGKQIDAVMATVGNILNILGVKMKQVSTYRVPSASRICMLVMGCDSSKGVVGLLSACAA